MSIKKRFIAGATCKQCQRIDAIRWCQDTDSGKEWIECAHCGYHEDKPDEILAAEHPASPEDSARPVIFKP